MPRSKSWYSLILLLTFLIGLAGLAWRKAAPSKSAPPEMVPVVGADTGKVPDGFGPIPTWAATRDAPENATGDTPPTANAARPLELPGAMREIAARMSRDTDGLEVITHPDGRRSVDLGGRFMHLSAVVTAADGSKEIRCFSDPQELAEALAGNPRPEVARPASNDR